MSKDRADIVTTTILSVMERWLRDPVLRDELVATLRDEIDDIRRELLADIHTQTE